MKITIITGIFPPDIGGPASYVPKIARELVKRGHSVKVVTLSDVPFDNKKYPFAVIRIKRSLFKLLRFLKTIYKIIESSRQADVLFINGLSFEAALAAWYCGLTTVHKVVGDYAWERARNRGWFAGTIDEYQFAPKGFLLLLIGWIRTFPLQCADRVIVPSRYLKRIVEGWSLESERIHVIYNAVEKLESADSPELSPSPLKTMVTVCRLTPWKGVDGLIRLLQDIPDVRLVVIGDGPMRHELESLAERLEADERTLFLGQVPKNQIHGYLKQADLFVLNSSYEGLPHVVLEAMAADTPVIATNVGGTGEVVLDGVTGRLIPSGDETALFAAIKEILENPDLARGMADKAANMLNERFIFKNMVDETEATLKLVVKS